MRKFIAGILFLGLNWAGIAAAQPVIEDIIFYTGNQSVSHQTSNIVPSGSNRALLVCITSEIGGGVDKTVTSVNFNTSETCNKVQSAREGPPQTSTYYATSWFCPNPSDVSANVSYTHQQAAPSTATVYVLSNAEQTTPTLTIPQVDTECNGCANFISGSITTVEDNTLLFTCNNSNNSGHTHTPGAGQTEPPGGEISFASHVHSTSYEVKSPAGTEVLSFTAVGSSPSNLSFVAYGIEPAAAAGAVRRRMKVWETDN
jgi:hypothetical protein